MLSRIMVDRKTHQHICYECNQTFESEGLLPTNIECAWCMESTNTKDSLIRYAMRYVKKNPSVAHTSCIFCGETVERGYFLSHMTFCSYIELHFETTIDQTEKMRENVLSDTFEGNLINDTLEGNTVNENDKIEENIVSKTEKENLLNEKLLIEQNDKTEEGFLMGKTEKLKEKVNTDFEENEDLKEKFYCEKCEFVCLSKDWLDVHKGITHDNTVTLFEDDKLKPKGLQSEECNICQKSFITKMRLSRHTETIHKKKKFTCPKCGQIFEELDDLQNHRNEFHTNDFESDFELPKVNLLNKVANYGCVKCDQIFHYYNNSISHEKTCGKLPECNLICDHCGKGFNSEYIMKRHVKTHVENESKLDCNECGKFFFTWDRLKIHKVNEHGGKKEELCNECGKCFVTSKR